MYSFFEYIFWQIVPNILGVKGATDFYLIKGAFLNKKKCKYETGIGMCYGKEEHIPKTQNFKCDASKNRGIKLRVQQHKAICEKRKKIQKQ